MKVVVTGGAGFIGANLCRELAAQPSIEVVALDDLSTGFRSNLDGVDAALVEGSILDRELLDEVISGAGSQARLTSSSRLPFVRAQPAAAQSRDDAVRPCRHTP